MLCEPFIKTISEISADHKHYYTVQLCIVVFGIAHMPMDVIYGALIWIIDRICRYNRFSMAHISALWFAIVVGAVDNRCPLLLSLFVNEMNFF